MKIKHLLLMSIFALTMSLISCDTSKEASRQASQKMNLVPLTKNVVDSFPNDFRNLQYYAGKKIFLKRSTESLTKEIIDGKLVIRKNIFRDSITILGRKEGVFIDTVSSNRKIKVSFTEKSNANLVFGQNENGTYVLFARSAMGKEPVGFYEDYNGYSWQLIEGQGTFIYFDRNELLRISGRNTIEEGRKLKH